MLPLCSKTIIFKKEGHSFSSHMKSLCKVLIIWSFIFHHLTLTLLIHATNGFTYELWCHSDNSCLWKYTTIIPMRPKVFNFKQFRRTNDTQYKLMILNNYFRARFIRAVSELQFLGFVKPTKRKTDHVARLTWGGCWSCDHIYANKARFACEESLKWLHCEVMNAYYMWWHKTWYLQWAVNRSRKLDGLFELLVLIMCDKEDVVMLL